MAATPISGAPLATKASSGPEPMPISIESAASACCTRGPPPKLITSTLILCFLKMPASMPTWSGTNWNVPTCGWPTRTLVCASAGESTATLNPTAAATRPIRDIVSSVIVLADVGVHHSGASGWAKAGHRTSPRTIARSLRRISCDGY
jgi:hypothetical protein